MSDGPELIAKVSAAARIGDPDAAAPHLEKLEAIASEELLPDLLSALEDEDPAGILWDLFYIAENLDDAYLSALLTALPGLHERAPRWAETAIIRILNTAGEPDDCTQTLLQLAADGTQKLRRCLVRIIKAVLKEPDELTPEQTETLERTLATLAV